MHKYKHIFDTTHLQVDLKKRSLRSGAVTLGSQGIMFVLQLASTMILARILNPADYGINAMAVAITGFAAIFSNLGLSTATIQRAEITHEQVSTLFWINVFIGALLTGLIALLSPAVAWFYKAPEMLWVMLSLSVIFMIGGLAVQHSALLTRQMQFYSIAKIQIISMLAGILVAIVTAHYGFGYWALVFNTLTNVTISTLGFWITCRWRPGLPRRNAGVNSMMKFGADLVSFDVVNYFSRNLDNILIGRYLGAGPLGMYSKAYQLLMMPITNLRGPIYSVAMPALSRLQKEPEQFRDYYLKCVSLLAFLSMPVVVFMYVCSEQIIILICGPNWVGASEIFRILAVAAFIQPVSGTSGMVLVSTGQSRIYFKLGVFSALVFCLSFVAGLPWGNIGVATGYSIANYLILFPILFYSYRHTSVKRTSFLKAVFNPLVASIGMGLCLFLLTIYIDTINIFIFLISSCLFCTFVYLLIYSIIPGGLMELKGYYDYCILTFIRNK